jgi:hypothetical protein
MQARIESPARADENFVLPVVDVDAIRFVANMFDLARRAGKC